MPQTIESHTASSLHLLSLGYVPVVNRGQRDIDTKKSITRSLEGERSFFENHQAYKSKAQYCGTPYLSRKLNMVCSTTIC